MSVQPSIESFFGKRKRIVTDDIYKAKHLKRGHSNEEENLIRSQPLNFDLPESKSKAERDEKIEKIKTDKAEIFKSDASIKTQFTTPKSKIQMDIRKSLKKCQEKRPIPNSESPVKFQLMGSLSPAKKSGQKMKSNKNDYNDIVVAAAANNKEKVSENKESHASLNNTCIKSLNFKEGENSNPTEDIIKSAKELVSKIKETQKKLAVGGNKKKELSLKEIKDKINRSSKLTELKKSINKINQHAEELIEIEKRKLVGTQPKLSKFATLEIPIPISPQKNSLYSPVKQQRSPSKPAYERFSSLVDTKTSLPLPFGYQRLYELFCAADTICSMITNRKEVLTFNKLKPGVEEMTRKTFTMRHLGQIATVYPEAYIFHQEKVKNFGSTSKVDKYELVLTPTIPKTLDSAQSVEGASKEAVKDQDSLNMGEKRVMTPKVMKARKEIFYKNLLEKTKDYHEEFLKTLERPIAINRNDLKRWHPNFMVDLVPDVNPQELPQPPNQERAATAKEVLDRAKAFLSSNVRLQKALEAASESSRETAEKIKPEISPEIKERVDSRLKNPLKGISKSLLEKVRARQAAKALDAMRMTPEQEKETNTYMRLPEMARIVRTLFVNEQKSVLPMEILMEKVQFSCNRNLGLNEVESHVRLLARLLPEWLTIVKLKNLNYVKINRNVDVASAMAKLKRLVEEKTTGKIQ